MSAHRIDWGKAACGKSINNHKKENERKHFLDEGLNVIPEDIPDGLKRAIKKRKEILEARKIVPEHLSEEAKEDYPYLLADRYAKPPHGTREWIKLQVFGQESPEWDPVEIPPIENVPADPPERTIRFSISPQTFPRDTFDVDVCNEIVHDMSEDNRFQIDHMNPVAIYSPIVIIRKLNSRYVADITFKTKRHAAIYSQEYKHVRLGSGVGQLFQAYDLIAIKAGLCHDASLLTIAINPDLSSGLLVDAVEHKDFANAILGLLDHFPSLHFVGLWREALDWRDRDIEGRPSMKLVVRCPDGFKTSSLPGYINSEKIFAGEVIREDAIWFKLAFAGRLDYCERCKFGVHPTKDCTVVLCNECKKSGHLKKDCPAIKKDAGVETEK